MSKFTSKYPKSVIVKANDTMPLEGFCVRCGKETESTVRVEVFPGDAFQEIIFFAGKPSSIAIPCCRECRNAFRRKKLEAIGSLLLGFLLFGVMALDLPMVISMISVFAAIMLILFVPLWIYTVGREKAVPVHISALSEGKLEFRFMKHAYRGKLNDLLQGNKNS